MTTTPNQITLYKTEGSADKVYALSVIPAPEAPGLYLLMYSNGRRGSTLKTNRKTPNPVTFVEAKTEFDKVMRSKMKDGYTESSDGVAYTASPHAGKVSGHRPMLPADLPKVGEDEFLQDLMTNDAYGAMEKMDGENRILMVSESGVVTGANKNGLLVDIPTAWQSLGGVGGLKQAVICGEQIGEDYYAFDLLELNGKDARTRPFLERYALLGQAVNFARHSNIGLVVLVTTTEDKRKYFDTIKTRHGEGLVFKHLASVFEAGKNTRTYRHKFVESMTCTVLAQNLQRSVAVGAMDGETMVQLGNVTISPNHAVPAVGSAVEVRYLYRHEGGCLIQPVYLGQRNDVLPEAITTEQIRRVKPRHAGAQDVDDSDGDSPRG